MSEKYLWQTIGGQGYNKYPKGIVGPGSKEVLDRAVNFHAGLESLAKLKDAPKTIIEVLPKDTFISNRWGDFGTDYLMKKGQLRMTYGTQPVEYMHSRWQKLAKKLGVDKLLDRAGSVDVKLMESTHRDAKTGEWLVGKLRKPGTVIEAVKDANIGVTIPTKEMTHVLTSEAAAAGKAATKLKPGMVIAADALGVYTPPLKTLLKKNKPVTEAGKQIAEKLQKFMKIQENAMKYVKEGSLKPENAEKAINNAWKAVQKFASKVK